MATRIEERFTVRASPETVWTFLVDPRQVIPCLPGAELTEVVDDHTFHGTVKVKVGPVTAGYKGRVEFVEVDAATRRVRMVGEGRETGGVGSARMRMESRLAPQPGGFTEVIVMSEVDVVGRLVQIGRGMIEQVAHQVFAQFSERVRAHLERPAAASGRESPAPAGTAPARTEPLRALPLFFRALWAWLKGLLGRAGRLH
ncbi:MAG TPA: SRPBCC family protein [Anaeromyxobacter sp.]|nr:SRPBCC family protein [Anaeromyxobacter sp.]